MADPVVIIVKQKNGEAISVTAQLGWDKFMLDYMMLDGVLGPCLWIPSDMVASITPPASNNVALVAGTETKQ